MAPSCADTCRWMSPVYERINGKTAVTRQPDTPAERERALHALLSCPTCGALRPNIPQSVANTAG